MANNAPTASAMLTADPAAPRTAQQANKRKVCRYIKAGSACPFGDRCRYVHEMPATVLVSAPAPTALSADNALSEPTAPVVSSPPLKGSAVRPARRAVVVEVPGLRSLSRDTIKGLTPERLRELQQAELRQMKRLFNSSYVAVASPDGAYAFEAIFCPTDPDFPYELPYHNGIRLHVTLPRLYPNDAPILSVIEGLPMDAAARVADALNLAGKLRRHQPMLRSLFIYLDRSLESLLAPPVVPDGNQATTQLKLKPAPRLLPPRPVDNADDLVPLPSARERVDESFADLLSRADAASVLQRINANTVHRTGSEDIAAPLPSASDNGAKSNYVSALAMAVEGSSAMASGRPQRGYAIRLGDLSINGIAIFTAARLGAALVCSRCRHVTEVVLLPEAPVGRACGRCNSPLLAVLRPLAAHATAETLGRLEIRGATARDLTMSTTIEVSCDGCGRATQIEHAVPGARELERHCHSCHSSMSVFFASVRFVADAATVAGGDAFGEDAEAMAASAQVQMRRRRKLLREVESSIVPGTPLPEEGKCAHYRRSRRWLRFSCCGRLFPCDICHDTALAARGRNAPTVEEISDPVAEPHVAARASRMVCGLCSREQPIVGAVDSPAYGLCVHCGADTVGHRQAKQFWEGGKGCRDVTRMSKNDAHKTRGMAKVGSKKLERVGVAGKERTAKRATSQS